MKKFRNDYKRIFIILLVIGTFNFIGCKSQKIELEVPVTNKITNTDLKKGYQLDNNIDILKVEIVKKISDGSYLLAYEVQGHVLKENRYQPIELKKVYLSDTLSIMGITILIL